MTRVKPKVVIAGGGFAGLETAFLLRHRLRDTIDLTLVSNEEAFLFRPNTIYIPFGADPESLRIPLAEPAGRQNIVLIKDEVLGVDTKEQRLLLRHERLPYDVLVIATGATMRPQEISGLEQYASTIWTPQQMLRVRESFARIEQRGRDGLPTEVVFVVPPNNKCAGPLYELVFMLDTYLRRHGARSSVRLRWVSFESSYIQAFGPKLHDMVAAEFAERGIEGFLRRQLAEVSPRQLRFADGDVMDYDELISFPPYIASLTYEGLPADDRGFLLCEPQSRAVRGVSNVYAPGDAGDFPVKQAFLAFLQADAAAEDIVARVTGHAPRVTFDAVSMCVMEQFDKATFAQVPLQTTGDPSRPVIVRPGSEHDYKVGVSPVWRLGKKLIGVYLPMRFRAGEPFHAGTAWRLMDVGLKGMAGVLAE